MGKKTVSANAPKLFEEKKTGNAPTKLGKKKK